MRDVTGRNRGGWQCASCCQETLPRWQRLLLQPWHLAKGDLHTCTNSTRDSSLWTWHVTEGQESRCLSCVLLDGTVAELPEGGL